MESKKLEALLMAVDLGSFTKAAEVLGYTQSGLTHMMNSSGKGGSASRCSSADAAACASRRRASASRPPCAEFSERRRPARQQ